MTPNQAREILDNPPQYDNWAGWMTIHRDLNTPAGSDASMREWAMQRMRDIAGQCDCGRIEHGRHHLDCPEVKSNKVACTARLAPEGLEVSPVCQSVQPPKSDPGVDLEALRADFGKLYKLAGKMHDYWTDEDFKWFQELGKKRGLE